jgi:hypothetical protein
MGAIETRVLSETKGLYLEVARKLSCWSEGLEKMRVPSQATKKPLKLFISVARSSRFTSRPPECHRSSSSREQCRLAPNDSAT